MPPVSLRTRILRKRPSAATVISLIALVFAMSGTAVAATGGNFILGRSNTAARTTSLTNSKGTALSLSSSATTPPLTVSNSVQVPKLNASELGGTPASGFLPVNGTAANASELGGTPASGFLPVNGTAANSNQLGGTPASGFIQGGGTISAARTSMTGGNFGGLLHAANITLWAKCDPNGPGSGATLQLFATSGAGQAFWLNKDGGGQADLATQDPFLSPGFGSTSPYTLVAQVDTGSSILTFTATERYDSSSDTCFFSAQVVVTNG